jgi:hypothetical protein
MHEYAAGIKPTSPAFATYEVKPQPGHLRKINCVSNSVKGLVKVEINSEPERFQLILTSPAKTLATVHFPLKKHGHRAIRVNDQPLWLDGKSDGEIPGINPVGESDGWVTFTVAPGAWTFESR